MAILDDPSNEIHFKIVYYGPGLAGKTTNLQFVYQRTDPDRRGKMISLATEVERTLFFDFRPATLPPLNGRDCRFHLFTVPGPVFYDTSRVLILKGVDGVVFVADSQSARAEANLESFENLETNLALHGYDIAQVPIVLQYNKRDLPDLSSVAELDELLGRGERDRFEASASQGVGVFDTLKAVVGRILGRARSQPTWLGA